MLVPDGCGLGFEEMEWAERGREAGCAGSLAKAHPATSAGVAQDSSWLEEGSSYSHLGLSSGFRLSSTLTDSSENFVSARKPLPDISPDPLHRFLLRSPLDSWNVFFYLFLILLARMKGKWQGLLMPMPMVHTVI